MGSQRYSGIVGVLDLELTHDDSASARQTRLRKTQTSKFDQYTPDSDIEDGDIILKKEDFGIPGTTEHHKNMPLATEALATLFGVTGEGIIDRISGEQDGNQKGYRHVQCIVSDMNHRVDEAHKQCKAFDFMDICSIAINSPLSKFCAGSAYALNTKFSTEDWIASRRLKEFIYNSSTDALRSAVGKKYNTLEVKLRGGVIYAYLTLREIFEVNRDAQESMKSFLKVLQEERSGALPRRDVV